MLPFKRRMAIAEDVLASLEVEAIRANTGSFVRLDLDTLNSVEAGQQLQPTFLNPELSCSVCALGACFVSAVKLGNDFCVTEDHIDNNQLPFSDINDTLSKYFSAAQMQLIEIAFEEGRGWWKLDSHKLVVTEGQFRAAQRFGSNAYASGNYYYGPTNKLKAIMKNIIDNKGTFKP